MPAAELDEAVEVSPVGFYRVGRDLALFFEMLQVFLQLGHSGLSATVTIMPNPALQKLLAADAVKRGGRGEQNYSSTATGTG